MNKFYMVLNQSTGYTKYRHGEIESARKEAERLAIQNPGTIFTVLESVGHAIHEPKCKWVEHENDLPF